jgi:hypothetical protein
MRSSQQVFVCGRIQTPVVPHLIETGKKAAWDSYEKQPLFGKENDGINRAQRAGDANRGWQFHGLFGPARAARTASA